MKIENARGKKVKKTKAKIKRKIAKSSTKKRKI